MAVSALPATRIAAFDGLRGVAAVIVVLYHYLCLMHPNFAPSMGTSLTALADTPLHMLWNGRFAVAVFFVLSGFVMAAAADRRREALIANSVTRYLRLALPVTASCLLAWIWLTAFPDSARALQQTLAEPSRWLNFTYQEPIKPAWYAVADGLAATFLRGYSRFNNVLWTMQIELVGSLGIFLLYFLAQGRIRLYMLAASGLAIVAWLPDSYLAFVLGAALYEAQRREVLLPVPSAVPLAALVGAVLLGSPGEGAHLRLDLPDVPEQWHVGRPRGLVPVLAAGLLLYAVLTLPAMARIFATPVPLFLGRISFGLYLVHVPPLYTVVASAHLHGTPELPLAFGYFAGTLLLALLFTSAVDEPLLRRLTGLRRWLAAATVPPAAVFRRGPRS
ncbi:acyltransferase family protein [Cereibacter sphaeroides]|jgi:peptidoglycan/LPS O-acetylase OafA/YrhL|nr:acyltransferase [Cereibacter sphaeroides]AMJ49873.1 acyltransferase [Cereibacter sphaeroides]ANS36584.1 acyltransferase [Cereibacter sphaeroides]ATN65649.1 acyltransferase [Cereibacter sphaeroides]QJC86933.1 acyltransferase [Cereibacter sphaeroides]